jgi:DNA-directed RNA polymerase subunit RPC12/RpoP
MIQFRCPECGKRIQAAPEKAGKPIFCPECDQTVRVPDRAREARAAPPPRHPDPFPIESVMIWGFIGGLLTMLGLACGGGLSALGPGALALVAVGAGFSALCPVALHYNKPACEKCGRRAGAFRRQTRHGEELRCRACGHPRDVYD